MADPKKLITAAKDALEIVELYPDTTKQQAEKVRQYFRHRKVLFSQIKAELKSCEKDADNCDGQVADAEKALKALSKAKADAALESKLTDAIKDAKSSLKAFRVNLEVLDKFTTEAEKDDGKLAETAAAVIKIGEPVLDAMESDIISIDGMCEAIQENFDKSIPVAAIKPGLTVATRNVMAIGQRLTTGESINSSIETLMKRKSDAFEPATHKLVDEVETMGVDMDKALKTLRPLYNNAIGNLRDFGERLKQVA
jgi:DNA repair exonuclease SbcCD ATPase subunit